MTDRTPCSDQSLIRGDPMFGTASPGTDWVFLELSGAWGPSAFLESPRILDTGLGREIVRRVESARMRIVAIRRPGKRPETPRWRWFIASATPGSERVVGGEVAGPRDYLDLALDGSDGAQSDTPLVVVCAHGKHDQCCAVRGRRAAVAVASMYPDWTWESSHLGGDRFAATMLIMPHGLSYGRVDTVADPATLVADYLAGRVNDSRLRGRTSLAPAVQAAQHFARERFGDNRLDAYPPLEMDSRDGRVVVVLETSGQPVEVIVDEVMSEPLLSTCAARIPGAVRQFSLGSIRTIG
ncbi:sucrase ferredoxin [Gordonia sp. NPDC003429]